MQKLLLEKNQGLAYLKTLKALKGEQKIPEYIPDQMPILGEDERSERIFLHLSRCTRKNVICIEETTATGCCRQLQSREENGEGKVTFASVIRRRNSRTTK